MCVCFYVSMCLCVCVGHIQLHCLIWLSTLDSVSVSMSLIILFTFLDLKSIYTIITVEFIFYSYDDLYTIINNVQHFNNTQQYKIIKKNNTEIYWIIIQ